jgi:penicillin-binding protein 1A
LRAGAVEQGFSTITMQLARNVFPERLPAGSRTLGRKLLEMRVAYEIESRFSKSEILELYLNHIYFGRGVYGIEMAAQEYFGKSASDLTLEEAALLAALPKAPTAYDPRRHPERALQRRNLILATMAQRGLIPPADAERARQTGLGVTADGLADPIRDALAPYFAEQVRIELENQLGTAAYAEPLIIHTTLDSQIQRAAEQELAEHLKKVERRARGPEPLQAAIVVLEAHTGDVLAWVGGRDFTMSAFDRVSDARRQAGSAFKPFVYAAALDEGYSLSQPVADTPLTMNLPTGEIWEPKNFGGAFAGAVTLRDALVYSRNIPTIRLAQAVGLDKVAAAAQRAGLHIGLEIPALALGAIDVSPLEMASAYTTFATLGKHSEPRLIRQVATRDGRVLWETETRSQPALQPETAFMITNVLTDALRHGTGAAALRSRIRAPAAGKTGTSNNASDTWFIGYTPEIVGAVWIGYDTPRPVPGGSGGVTAAPLWGRLASRIYEKRDKPQQWKRPAGVKYRAVDRATGLLLSSECYTEEPQYELFISGFEPRAFCPGDDYPGKPFFITREILGGFGLMLFEPEVAEEPLVEDATAQVETLR